MRAAIYARYSSERQSETSLDDQIRIATARCEALGLTVVAVHGDDAISGSTPVGVRPAGKALLADALAARIDAVVLEGLDRLSRELGEQERIVKRLEHRGIRIVGVADGYDSQAAGRKVMRIARGMINELYLDDLRHKTHRGQDGAVLRGGHAGGVAYGYRSVVDERGARYEIDPEQAAVVRRIFDAYADGDSPQRIAHRLNREGVPAPRGGTWAVSALYGSPRKGSGVLNNELYVGRYIWNRSQWLKDPDTGKRTRVDRPKAEWRIEERPELRILSEAQWAGARARMTVGDGPRRGAPPKTLFGGLLRCSHCGGSVVAVDGFTYGCAAAKDRGTCVGVRVPRQAADSRLLSAVRDDVLGADAAAYVRRQVREAMASAGAEAERALRGAAGRRKELEGEIGRLVDAIAAVGVSPALGAKLKAAEAELAALRDPAPAAAQRFSDAEIDATFRRIVLKLEDALRSDVRRARQIVGEILGPVTVRQEGAEVWAEAKPAAEQMLAAGGMKIIRVAGGRSVNWKRWRIK